MSGGSAGGGGGNGYDRPKCDQCGNPIAAACVCAPCAATAVANAIDLTSANVCTLLGPTRHYVSFDAASIALGKLGWLVFSVGSHRMSDLGLATTDEERRMYWRTHREKMDMSSMAFVVDMPTPSAHRSMRRVGRDTVAEIQYAERHGLQVVYMSDVWNSGTGGVHIRGPPAADNGGGKGGKKNGGGKGRRMEGAGNG